MFSKLYLRDRWTIGFIESDVAAIIEKRISSPQIHWLQHSYTDRFWADPFILDLEKDGSIRVLAEEMIWTKAKGTIVELLISPDYQLLDRWVILEEDVHLSYPFIERVAGEVYVYPESSHKGHLMKYRLCNHKLVEVGVELALPICDATKVVSNGYEWWFGTLLGKGKDRDLLVFYRPIGEVGEYRSHPHNPIVSNSRGARPAGAFIQSNSQWYRCAQDSSKTYGGGLSIAKVDLLDRESYQEQLIMQIHPDINGECPNGIHTINGYKGLTVVDGIRPAKFAPITKIIFVVKSLIQRHGWKKLA